LKQPNNTYGGALASLFSYIYANLYDKYIDLLSSFRYSIYGKL